LYKVIGEVIGYDIYDDLMDRLNLNNNVEEQEPNSDFSEDEDNDYIPEPPESNYKSDNDAIKFSRSMLQRQGITFL
jgi:hypothetical protein